MRAWGRTVGLVLLAALPLAGSCAALEPDADPKVNLVIEAQAAIRADDKQWFAAHLHLPVHYYGNKQQTIRSKARFLQHYAILIGPKLKATVLAQDPQAYFENYQGVMVGEGSHNIWFADFGGDAGPKFEIITINDSDR